MRNPVPDLRHSYSLKAMTIGLLSLLLLIPVAMVRGVINDRETVGSQGRADIMRSWGGAQMISGPILMLPYDLTRVTQYGEIIPESGTLYLLPETLSVDVDIDSEIRYRGAHTYPVYTADTVVGGTFRAPNSTGLGIDKAEFRWDLASVAIAVLEPRFLRSAPYLDVAGERSRFDRADTEISGLPPLLVAPLSHFADESARADQLSFSIGLALSGTESLRVLPLGDDTSVTMRSNWQDPSFVGAHLPEQREVSEDGFDASWRVSGFGRSFPSRWLSKTVPQRTAADDAFGVKLFVPVGLYQLTDRATKYAVMFIGLTFIAYFLFEILAGLKLHALQYLLVGLGNAMFYLLLLSLAEHLGFGVSYLISSSASIALIAGYSYSVLGSRRRAMAMSGILAGLYGFLYMTLNAAVYALLAGSIGLWLILATVMYLTRKIDWFKTRSGHDGQAEMSY